MIAAKVTETPFSRIVACELESVNAAALRARLAGTPAQTTVIEGDCNAAIEEVLRDVPPSGLNLAFIDPYGINGLKFETLRRLAAFQRMDLLIHFPRVDLKRNLGQGRNTSEMLDRALGTTSWRVRQRRRTDIATLVQVFAEQLQTEGSSSGCNPSETTIAPYSTG